jgi:hypothetical protein
MSKSNLEITPSNVLSNGKISFRNGNPVISFIIGEQDRMLIGKSVRLCGKFRARLVDADGAASFVSEAGNGVQLSIPSRLGMYSAIQQVVIRSQQTHQVIEHIRHYNRFMSSYLPVITSLQDGMTHNFNSSLQLPNYQAQKVSVMNLPSQETSGNAFCLPLVCGLFNGVADIPLSQTNGLGGLLIEVHLDSDSNVMFAQNGVTTNLENASYEFSDVKLVCEVREERQPSQKQTNTFEYNSISSYFTSINSTNGVINFNLGLSRVLGCFLNFIESSKINNLSEDGMATQSLINSDSTPARTEQVVFTRGGEKFPLEYNIDYLGTDGLTYNEVDSQVYRNYLNAIKNFAGIDRMTPSVRSTNYSQGGEVAPNGRDVERVDGGNAYGVGVAYDVVSDQGVDFSSSPWGLQLTTGLVTQNPQACYLFVHSKNTLLFSPQGLQVIN